MDELDIYHKQRVWKPKRVWRTPGPVDSCFRERIYRCRSIRRWQYPRGTLNNKILVGNGAGCRNSSGVHQRRLRRRCIIRRRILLESVVLKALTENVPESQAVKDLAPVAGEYIVRKTQPLAFFGTNLAA